MIVFCFHHTFCILSAKDCLFYITSNFDTLQCVIEAKIKRPRDKIDMKKINKYLLLIILIAFISCEDNSTSSEFKEENVSLAVSVSHYYGDNLVEPEVSVHTNSSGNEIKFFKLHYLLTNFVLVNSEGKEIVIDSSAAYINMTEGLVDFVLPNIPIGDYKEIKFLLGVDSTTNHQSQNTFPASSPLNPIINNLYWDWIDGFIFCSVEGYHYKEGQEIGSFAYHIGMDENLMRISIKNEFKVAKDKPLELVFDLSAYFESPNLINITENAPITHSNKTADFGLSSKLSENLLHAFKLKGK